MTDTRFSVQLPELAETTRRLGEVERHLAVATRRVESLGSRQAGDVAAGLRHFGDHWEHGLNRLRSHVGELHAALAAAHEGYASHEASLTEGFER